MNVVDAYKLAWQEAERLGSFDEEILLRKLGEVSDWPADDDDEDDEDGESGREVLQELLVGFWHERVPPRRLGKHMRRAARRAAFEMFRDLWHIWHLLKSGWTPRWMQPPRGVDVFDAFDSDEDDRSDHWALPWKVTLDDDWNMDLLMRAVAARPKDEEDEDEDDEDEDVDEDDEEPYHDIPVWLSAASTPPRLDVMIGKERLVGARSDLVWAFLQKVADEYQGVDGDLSVWDPQDHSHHEVAVPIPRDELPPEYVKSVLNE